MKSIQIVDKFRVRSGIFKGRGAPLRSGVTTGEVKTFLKQIQRRNFILRKGGERTSYTLPLDLSLKLFICHRMC